MGLAFIACFRPHVALKLLEIGLMGRARRSDDGLFTDLREGGGLASDPPSDQ